MIDCLACGFRADAGDSYCRKCGERLGDQAHAGSYHYCDLGHRGLSVTEAITAFEREWATCCRLRVAAWRLVVGDGLIKQAVLTRLRHLRAIGEIHSFTVENPGSLWIERVNRRGS